MALARLVIVASAAVATLAAEPRPTNAEWEADQAAKAGDKQAVADKAKKASAVNKAVELLKTLQQKVLAEGEAEANTYDKFACFCKDTTKDKLEAIQKGEDEKAALIANINALTAKRDGLDQTIQGLIVDIQRNELDMKQATALRHDQKNTYDMNSADLKAALDALEGALGVLKASKAPSLVQVRSVSQTVKQALLLASTMGITSEADEKVIAFLQKEPSNEVPMEDYDFHSNGIIGVLEKLLGDFRAENVDNDKVEAMSIHEFDSFMQERTDDLKALNHNMDTAKEDRDNTIADIESSKQRLTTVEALLADDKEYTNKLSQMCTDKAKTWDQRSSVRAGEVQVLTQAIGIISGAVADKTSASTIRFMQQGVSVGVAESVAANSDDMVAIEAAAEAQDAPSFLQQGSTALAVIRRLRGSPAANSDGGRALVLDLLKSRGTALKSTLLTALASQLAKDPLAKVKTLIQELIERLLQEANNESNQKGFCDKATQDATQKRDYAAEKVRALNAEMATLEAVRDTLKEELSVLATEIAQIKDAQKQAQDDRDAEAAQNKATVEEAEQGLDALNMCIDLLDKFYKIIAKGSVDLSLVQKGPEDDAPDAGFDNGEAYLGGQSESGGILAMLDVMKSDFTRTIQETQKAEEQAQQDHLDFMTESGKSLAQKTEAESAKTEQLDDTEQKLGEAEEGMHSQTEILRSAVKELLDLKPVCIDTGMSYEERVSRREDEIAGLNKAMCILERYAEYGPEGAAGAC